MSVDHILLVEDDNTLLKGMCDLLELAGYQVSLAEDGAVALQVLETSDTTPSLIVSDIRMPNMDGYEFLEAVRERPEWLSIPFIFLTAKGEKEDIRDGKLRGADDYLTKPFDFRDLLVAVQSTIRRHEELSALQESRMEALKQRILTVLNHEFRTPLSFIVAYADLMATSPTFEHSEELRQYIDGILEGSERLQRLVESFLVLAELETGQGPKTYERRKALIENPEELIRDVIETAQCRAASKGVGLELLAASSLPPVIGDQEYLKLAFGHLLDNAIKFSPSQPQARVTVSVTTNEQDLIVAVRDQGRGIPPQERERLFDPFYQVDREQYEQPGAGVGLAIVHHVAELHRARVEVESQPGQGSCFRFRLPAYGDDAELS